MTIEGFLEEGLTLDINCEYGDILKQSFDDFRIIFKEISDKKIKNVLNDADCCKIAQQIRKIRKPLCQNFATFI
jgi:hypothetical protein